MYFEAGTDLENVPPEYPRFHVVGQRLEESAPGLATTPGIVPGYATVDQWFGD